MKIFTVKEPMSPPWLMYPHISRYSIGWRMGCGEGYAYDFWQWFGSLTNEEQNWYKEAFPAPKLWREIYNKNYEPKVMDNFYCKTVELWNENGAQQYSREKLVKDYNKGKEIKYIFFWKPQADVLNESCLGQWQPSKFKVEIDEYSCAEQYMMAKKARVFEDKETCEKILQSRHPKEMKALGKEVKNFDQTVWDKVKYSIVLNGNYFKFTQNKNMMDYLLSTGNRVLAEASPMDTIWGIGLGNENEKAQNPNTWRGQNLLGFALMEVRDEIKTVYKNYDKIAWEKLHKEYD